MERHNDDRRKPQEAPGYEAGVWPNLVPNRPRRAIGWDVTSRADSEGSPMRTLLKRGGLKLPNDVTSLEQATGNHYKVVFSRLHVEG